jgi:hypothetical protein
MAELKII